MFYSNLVLFNVKMYNNKLHGLIFLKARFSSLKNPGGCQVLCRCQKFMLCSFHRKVTFLCRIECATIKKQMQC